jgi:hypothetical protein
MLFKLLKDQARNNHLKSNLNNDSKFPKSHPNLLHNKHVELMSTHQLFQDYNHTWIHKMKLGDKQATQIQGTSVPFRASPAVLTMWSSTVKLDGQNPTNAGLTKEIGFGSAQLQ